ncbi:uncharacterized protein LOC124308548 [Neodiprion virginianus]|uniref:uncharacterized protein LOC124308548 n=1 Tax=Neodiprion virginianus TaxID=2961670 RepID=UPI001EE6A1C8|nr:uncharacterized protein LOC124308548 [Neodiprion virginianus]
MPRWEIFIRQFALLQSLITVTIFFGSMNIEAAPIADLNSVNLTTEFNITGECLPLGEIAKFEKYPTEKNDDPQSGTGFPVINAAALTSDDFARVEYKNSELSPFGDDQADWMRLKILHDLLQRPQDDFLKSNFQTVYKFLVTAYKRLRSGKKITENSHMEDRSGGENSSLEDGVEKDEDKRVFHTSSTSSTSDGLPHRLYRSTLIHSEINDDDDEENDYAESLDDLLETTGVAASKLDVGKTNLYLKPKTTATSTESMRIITVVEHPTEETNTVSKTLLDSGEDDSKSEIDRKYTESNSVTTEIKRVFDATGDFRSILTTEEEGNDQQLFNTTLKNLDTVFEGSTRTDITAQNNFVTEITTAENNNREIGSTAMSNIESGVYGTMNNIGVGITTRINSQSETTWKSIFEAGITIENDTETKFHAAKNNSGFENRTRINSEFENATKKISEPENTTEINNESSIYGTMSSSEPGITAENNSGTGIKINYNNTETEIATTGNNFSTIMTTEKSNIQTPIAAKNNSDAKFTIKNESDVNVETKITTLRNDIETENSTTENNVEIGIAVENESGIKTSFAKNDFETEKISHSSQFPGTSIEFSTVSQFSEKINGNPDGYRMISDRFHESLESTTVSSRHVAGISDIPYSATSEENDPDIPAVTKPEDGDKIAGNSGDEEAELSIHSQTTTTTTTIFHPSSTDRGIPVRDAKKVQVILKIGDIELSPYNGMTRSTEVGLVKIPGSKNGRKEFSGPTNYVSRIYNLNDNEAAIEEEGENEDSVNPKSSYNDPYSYAKNFDSDHPHRHLPRYHRFDESLDSGESKASWENYRSKNFPHPQVRVPVKRGGHNTNIEKLYRWFYRTGQEAENPDLSRRGLLVRYIAKPEIRCKELAKVRGDR